MVVTSFVNAHVMSDKRRPVTHCDTSRYVKAALARHSRLYAVHLTVTIVSTDRAGRPVDDSHDDLQVNNTNNGFDKSALPMLLFKHSNCSLESQNNFLLFLKF